MKKTHAAPTSSPRRFRLPGQRASRIATRPVLVHQDRATDDCLSFVYAVIAALGLTLIDQQAEHDQDAVVIELNGHRIAADNRQWHHPDHEAGFEHWLTTACFPAVRDPAVWAIVQTSTDTFPLLAPALAYAHSGPEHHVLLIDADATETPSQHILTATDHAIPTLAFDFQLPSPHVYLLNAPRWHHVTMLLQVDRANPLNSVLLPETLRAAQQHFHHTVIDCGADLFLAQRLATHGVRVIHVDDYSRPLHTTVVPHRAVNYFNHRIPVYGTRRDFEFLVRSSAGRRTLRRWLAHGDQS